MGDDMNFSVELCMIICASSSDAFDKDEVLRLLSSGADINFQDANRNFNTPLHLAIERKNIELIKVLLLFNPSRRIRNMNGERAREFALNLNYFDIVKVLDEHRETSKEAESLSINRKLYEKEAAMGSKSFYEVQSDLHSESSASYTSSRVQFLLSITKIDPHYKRTSFDSRAVKQVYVKLDENIWLRPLLKVAKDIKTLDIYFLYDQFSAEPKPSNDLTGTIFLCGLQTISDFSAILARKLFYYTMNHVNDNDCKPYRRKQNEEMIRYRKIVTVYKRRIESLNPKIQQVFQLPEALWDSELIAWVPYFIALFIEHPEKLAEITEIHQELFDFFFQVVLKDIDEFLVRNNRIKFKSRPVEGSSFGKHYDPYKTERLAENYGSNYRHNKRNNRDLERICSIL
jgi:RNase H-fold protein (predicted Holliday junction resolvase)